MVTKHEKKGNDDNSNHVNATSSDVLLVVYDENLINVSYNETNWVVDSGVAFHVTSIREFFIFFSSHDFGFMKIGNDELSKVGTGTISLETDSGSKVILEVRCVPDIRLHLISTCRLDDDGYCNIFNEG